MHACKGSLSLSLSLSSSSQLINPRQLPGSFQRMKCNVFTCLKLKWHFWEWQICFFLFTTSQALCKLNRSDLLLRLESILFRNNHNISTGTVLYGVEGIFNQLTYMHMLAHEVMQISGQRLYTHARARPLIRPGWSQAWRHTPFWAPILLIISLAGVQQTRLVITWIQLDSIVCEILSWWMKTSSTSINI